MSGAVADATYQLSLMRQWVDESDEQFAARQFYQQMEVYSANAGRDLYNPGDFERLDKETRDSWILGAKGHTEKYVYAEE